MYFYMTPSFLPLKNLQTCDSVRLINIAKESESYKSRQIPNATVESFPICLFFLFSHWLSFLDTTELAVSVKYTWLAHSSSQD